MIIENTDALKNWLTSTLGTICDADPGALSKYILALLKKDRSEAELKDFCLDQLWVFLLKDTSHFVGLLFDTLRTKSYLQNSVSSKQEKGDIEKDSQNSENVPKSICNSEIKCASTESVSREKEWSKRTENVIEKENENEEISPGNTSTKLMCSKDSSYSRSRSKDKAEKKKDSSPVKEATFQKEFPVALPIAQTHYSTDFVPFQMNSVSSTSQVYRRCKDFDEMGYCMRGDFCIFDHGADPVIVEDVSALNFGVPLAHVPSNATSVSTSLAVGELQKMDIIPPPPPPSSPPPLPPPPPLPSPGAYIPEPYNPESPAMDITSNDMSHSTYLVPSHVHAALPVPSRHRTRVLPQNSKPLRSRELIGVPTIDRVITPKRRENDASLVVPTSKRRKGFDYSRLGFKSPSKRLHSESVSHTLELRQVPATLNSISLLYEHFAKYGIIRNIQICYSGDPEAALIQFASASEATAAYKSSEAVLNNRFIQVFWHMNEESIYQSKRPKNLISHAEYKPYVKNFVKNPGIISAEKSPTSGVLTHKRENYLSEKKKEEEKSVIYSSGGNLCKTVFNPAVLKKTGISSSASALGCPKVEKKDALSRKLQLYKKKQEFLDCQIQNQKVILSRLSKLTDKNDKLRPYLKKMLNKIGSTITNVQCELKDFHKAYNSQTQKTRFTNSEKTEMEKELLDAEMDLYKISNKGDENDTAALLRKVNELKQKAKALGLLESSPYPSEVGPKSKQFSKSNAALLRIDNRPKTLLVSGIEDKEREKCIGVLKSSLQFGEIQKIEERKSGFTVTLSTRKAAEMMLLSLKGSKLDENMTVSWFQKDHNSVSEGVNEAKFENGSIQFDEDEEDEEDSEARSWRH